MDTGSGDKSKHKFSLFSKQLQWLDWNGMAETARKIGFDGLDLTIRPNGHVNPERVEDDLPKVVETCRGVGIEITMLTTTIQDVTQPTTEKILKTASKLGICKYRMDWYHYDKAKSIELNLVEFTSKMQELAAMNAHYQINGAYQNHDGGWFGAPVWDLARVLSNVDSQWMGCQYDICNATIEGAKSWPLGLELLAPFIHSIDIKDFIWAKRNGAWYVKYVPLGQGAVDFGIFFKQLQDLSVNVPFSLHLEYDLGGANKGASRLTIPKRDVVAAMSRDLNLLKEICIPPGQSE